MQFKKLKLKNFMSFHSVQIDLSKQGVLLVEGLNGAGKSSLFCEALVWCLFGSTIKDDSADAVVNNTTGKDCKVSISFSIDDVQFKVIRYRKHHKQKNNLVLKRIKKGKWRGMSGSSIASTQAAINSLLGLDMFAFVNSVIFGQGNITRYATASDAERKKILEELLMLTWIPASYQKVKKDHQEATSFADDLQNDYSKLRMIISDEKESMSDIKDEQKAQFLASIDHIVDSLDDYLKAEELMQEAMDIIIPFTSKIDLKVLQDEYNSAKKDHVRIQKIFHDLSEHRDKGSIDAMIANIEKHIVLTKKSIGKAFCITCGQELKNKTLIKYIKKQKKELSRWEGILKSEKTRLIKHTEYLQVKKEFSRASVKVADAHDTLQMAKENLQHRNDAFSKVIMSYDLMKRAIKASKRQTVSSGGGAYVKIKKRMLQHKKDAKSLKQQLEDQNEKIIYLSFWKNAFGNQGIKSVVLAAIIPYLNQKANAYADILTEGKIKITFTNEQKLASGAVREKFDVIVKKVVGASSYKSASGGEKQMVDICVALALRDLILERGAKGCNLLILDEPFESLDEINVSRVVDMLNGLVKKNSSVCVITHLSDLADHFTNRIKVYDEGGQSKIRMAI